jgi:FMN phosphatase YigB (HAD superfamily)
MAGFDAPVKAAIFDIGATLVTGPPVAPNKAIAKLLNGAIPPEARLFFGAKRPLKHSPRGNDFTGAEMASVIMTRPFESADEVCAALEAEFGPIDGPTRVGVTDLWNSQASAATELDGASETVLSLKQSGIRIGLLSDIWSPYYKSVEKALPRVIEAADSIVLSCRTGCRKPEPTNFELALDELGVKPEEAVMIGDTYEHDILPALELGMRTVWVLARPDREVRSIIKVLNWHSRPPTWTVWDIREVQSLNAQLSTLNIGR